MPIDIDHWCRHHLGAGVSETLFSAGHLSQVRAVRLSDGRTAVVKARADSPRLAACVNVQRTLWRAGFPAPQPLAGPIRIDGLAVTAEVYIPGGTPAPDTEAVTRFAGLLARMIALGPTADSIGSLEPDLPWTAWAHGGPGTWPAPDDRDANLNAVEHATPWLDEVGDRVRSRLAEFAWTDAGRNVVVGHGDWEAQNLRWQANQPLVVHDWDSVVRAPEAIIAGFAASVWPCGIKPSAATAAESAEFIDAYQQAAGRTWSDDEVEASWAAGLWVYAFNAKKASLDGATWLTPDEAERRLRLSGA